MEVKKNKYLSSKISYQALLGKRQSSKDSHLTIRPMLSTEKKDTKMTELYKSVIVNSTDKKNMNANMSLTSSFDIRSINNNTPAEMALNFMRADFMRIENNLTEMRKIIKESTNESMSNIKNRLVISKPFTIGKSNITSKDKRIEEKIEEISKNLISLKSNMRKKDSLAYDSNKSLSAYSQSFISPLSARKPEELKEKNPHTFTETGSIESDSDCNSAQMSSESVKSEPVIKITEKIILSPQNTTITNFYEYLQKIRTIIQTFINNMNDLQKSVISKDGEIFRKRKIFENSRNEILKLLCEISKIIENNSNTQSRNRMISNKKYENSTETCSVSKSEFSQKFSSGKKTPSPFKIDPPYEILKKKIIEFLNTNTENFNEKFNKKIMLQNEKFINFEENLHSKIKEIYKNEKNFNEIMQKYNDNEEKLRKLELENEKNIEKNKKISEEYKEMAENYEEQLQERVTQMLERERINAEKIGEIRERLKQKESELLKTKEEINELYRKNADKIEKNNSEMQDLIVNLRIKNEFLENAKKELENQIFDFKKLINNLNIQNANSMIKYKEFTTKINAKFELLFNEKIKFLDEKISEILSKNNRKIAEFIKIIKQKNLAKFTSIFNKNKISRIIEILQKFIPNFNNEKIFNEIEKINIKIIEISKKIIEIRQNKNNAQILEIKENYEKNLSRIKFILSENIQNLDKNFNLAIIKISEKLKKIEFAFSTKITKNTENYNSKLSTQIYNMKIEKMKTCEIMHKNIQNFIKKYENLFNNQNTNIENMHNLIVNLQEKYKKLHKLENTQTKEILIKYKENCTNLKNKLINFSENKSKIFNKNILEKLKQNEIRLQNLYKFMPKIKEKYEDNYNKIKFEFSNKTKKQISEIFLRFNIKFTEFNFNISDKINEFYKKINKTTQLFDKNIWLFNKNYIEKYEDPIDNLKNKFNKAIKGILIDFGKNLLMENLRSKPENWPLNFDSKMQNSAFKLTLIFSKLIVENKRRLADLRSICSSEMECLNSQLIQKNTEIIILHKNNIKIKDLLLKLYNFNNKFDNLSKIMENKIKSYDKNMLKITQNFSKLSKIIFTRQQIKSEFSKNFTENYAILKLKLCEKINLYEIRIKTVQNKIKAYKSKIKSKYIKKYNEISNIFSKNIAQINGKFNIKLQKITQILQKFNSDKILSKIRQNTEVLYKNQNLVIENRKLICQNSELLLKAATIQDQNDNILVENNRIKLEFAEYMKNATQTQKNTKNKFIEFTKKIESKILLKFTEFINKNINIQYSKLTENIRKIKNLYKILFEKVFLCQKMPINSQILALIENLNNKSNNLQEKIFQIRKLFTKKQNFSKIEFHKKICEKTQNFKKILLNFSEKSVQIYQNKFDEFSSNFNIIFDKFSQQIFFKIPLSKLLIKNEKIKEISKNFQTSCLLSMAKHCEKLNTQFLIYKSQISSLSSKIHNTEYFMKKAIQSSQHCGKNLSLRTQNLSKIIEKFESKFLLNTEIYHLSALEKKIIEICAKFEKLKIKNSEQKEKFIEKAKKCILQAPYYGSTPEFEQSVLELFKMMKISEKEISEICKERALKKKPLLKKVRFNE